jgi:MFS family permease
VSKGGFLPLLAFSRFGAGVANMVYAGSLPVLIEAWHMTGVEAGSIQATFNLCYAISLLLCSWASDHVGARRVFVAANWLSALAFLACALFARSHESGVILFGLLALALGGSYTPAIILVSEATAPTRRGSAIGLLLTGSSLGYFVAIAACAGLAQVWGVPTLWLLLSSVPLLAAIAGSLGARNLSPPGTGVAGQGSVTQAMLSRNSVLLTAGYTAHCWELLGMWAWMPAFLTFVLAGTGVLSPLALGLLIAAALHLSGAASTMAGGWASDRWGRKATLIGMAAAGALLSLVIGWSTALPTIVVLVLAFLYGFAALGDSGVLSTAMADAVPAGQLGRLLALRSILGFGAGALSPLAFGWILDLTNPPGALPSHWGWAFTMLAAGGILATLAAWFLNSGTARAALRIAPDAVTRDS